VQMEQQTLQDVRSPFSMGSRVRTLAMACDLPLQQVGRITQKTSFCMSFHLSFYPPLVPNLVFSPSNTYANWFYFYNFILYVSTSVCGRLSGAATARLRDVRGERPAGAIPAIGN
jgi:hypothetical protein